MVQPEPARSPTQRQEHLENKAKVTNSILAAYLAWAKKNLGDPAERLRPYLDAETVALISKPLPENRRVLFRTLVAVAKAIAAARGGPPEETYRELGRHSADINLAGAYKKFSSEVPHQFFDHMDHLLHTFQNFGKSDYTRTGERSGTVRLEGYHEYSPVYCDSAPGYYEEALRMMKAPGPIRVVETSCQCAGQAACVYELSW